MDIHETARRLWSRWPVIGALMVAGALAGGLLNLSGGSQYTSTTRVLADADGLTTPRALADELLAVATTTTRLENAIADTGADRSPAEVAARVVVEPLGESPVLAMSVTDPDPDVAAALANSLAQQSVATLASSAAESAGQVEPAVRPAVIEQAHPAQSPDRSRTVPDIVLGLFLGALVGVGIAALLETLRPTLVAPRYVAAEFDTRLLGDATPAGARSEDGSGLIAPITATTVGYAAARADVRTLWLVAVDPLVDIEPLAADLRATLPQRGQSTERAESEPDDAAMSTTPTVKVWTPYREVFPDPDGKWSGLVIVAPPRLPRSAAEPIREIVDLVSVPVLGLIAYQP